MSETMKATIDRYAHLAGHLEDLTTSADFGFNIAREFWSAMKLGQAEIHTKDKRTAELEGLLREHEGVTRDAVAVTLAGNAVAGELVEASARIAQLEREIDGRDKRIAELDAEVRKTHSEVAGLRAGPQAAKVAAWSTVWDLQSEHVNTWRDKAEWYWFARFSEEVGELGGALVGNHEGPVEWELSQVAAIALNWLDMRADRAAKGGR